MGLADRVAALATRSTAVERSETRYSADTWLNDFLLPYQQQFGYNGNTYTTGLRTSYGEGLRAREISQTLPSYMAALRTSPPAFAAQMVRALVISQARFTFRNLPSSSQPRKTFGTRALAPLEHPAPLVTTGEMNARMEWHSGLAGNAYVYRQPDQLRVLRPDFVAIVLGSNMEPDDPAHALDAKVIGFAYANQGLYSGNNVHTLLPGEVAHFAPLPDPEMSHIGMSWITPAIREIQNDRAASEHKLRFYSQGATPNLVIKGIPAVTKDQFNDIVGMLEERHTGVANAFKTLYLTAGADATVIGSNFKDMDLKAITGSGETRISFLSRVPAAILGISEGLAGSSLNAGNFDAARRLFADTWVYPTLQDLAGSLADIIDVPSGAELWFDPVDMPLLREDAKVAAEIFDLQVKSITVAVREGFTAESSVAATVGQNPTILKHTGLTSVQLQKPGQESGGPGEPGSAPAEPPLDLTRPLALKALRSAEFEDDDEYNDDELRRRPYPGQKYHHGWIPIGISTAAHSGAVSAEHAQRIRELKQHIEKLRREGPEPYERSPQRYVETELHQRLHGLPIGSRIPRRPEKLGFESLPSGHWRDPATGRLHGEMGPMGWMDDLAAAEEYLQQLKDPDYWRVHGETAAEEIELLKRQARRLRMRRQRQARSSDEDEDEDSDDDYLDLETRALVDALDRFDTRDRYNVRIPKGFEGGGRYRKISDLIFNALEKWAKGEGPANPFEDLKKGRSEQQYRDHLRKAALERGLTVRRGAGADEIADQLLDDVRGSARKDRDADKPSAKFTLQGKTHRDLDVAVYKDPQGRPALFEESDSGKRKRGLLVPRFDSLEALQAWAQDNDEPRLAEWARKEGGKSGPKGDDGLDDLHTGALADLAREHEMDVPYPPRESDRESILTKLRTAGVVAPADDEPDPSKPTGPRQLDAEDFKLLDSGVTRPGVGIRKLSESTGRNRQHNERIEQLRREGYLKKERGSDHWTLTDRGHEALAEWTRKEQGGKEPAKKAVPAKRAPASEISPMQLRQMSESEILDAANDGSLLRSDAVAELRRRSAGHARAADGLRGGDRDGNVSPMAAASIREQEAKASQLRRLADDIEAAGERKAAPAKRAPAKKATPKPDLDSLRRLGDTEAIRDELDLRKMDELKPLLREAGLPVSGRKRNLVDRLTDHLSGKEAPAKAPRKATPKAPTPDVLDVPDLVVNESEPLRGDPEGDNMRMHGDSPTMGVAQAYAAAGRNGSANRMMDLRRRSTTSGADGITPQQTVDELRAIRAGETDPAFQRRLDRAIAQIDAPKRPVPEIPVDTPPAARKLIEDLNDIPYARKGNMEEMGGGVILGSSLVDQLAQVYRDAAAGKRDDSGRSPSDRVRKILRDQTHEVNEASFRIWALADAVESVDAPGGGKQASPLTKELRSWERGELPPSAPAKKVTPTAATNLADLSDADLKARAVALGIPNAANMTRAQLLAALGERGVTRSEPDDAETRQRQEHDSLRLRGIVSDDDGLDYTEDELRALDIHGDEFEAYWTRGKGLRRWLGRLHEWTTLRNLLRKHPRIRDPEGLANKYFHMVKGFYPGSDLHRVEHGKPPRGHRIGPG